MSKRALFSDSDISADETIVMSALAASIATANAYLNATLSSTTPEVRRLFSEYTTQSIMAHDSLTNLSVKKNWITPYDTPEQQLEASMQTSQSVLGLE